MTAADLRIAVLVPCYNEEAAIATVVADFRKALPAATSYVYDNNSKDRTVAVARAAGEGSFSKLNTWRDGFRILGTVLRLYRTEKPLRFFTAIGVFLMLVSIGLAIPIVITYLEEGLVPRLPTAVLSAGLMIVAVLLISAGLVLDTVTRGRREMKLLAYLSQPPIGKR